MRSRTIRTSATPATCWTRRRSTRRRTSPTRWWPAGPFPPPEELGVGDAPYLNGMAETIGEGRRHVLDLLRTGDVATAERMLAMLEDMYGVLVTIDYPDAITMNLRRSTDVARSLIEKTRGDLSIAFVQRDLHDALERHARLVEGDQS